MHVGSRWIEGVPSVVVFISLSMLIGCSATNRVALDQVFEFEGTGTTSQDFRSVCEKMARSLVTVPQIAHAATPPTVALLEVRNQTNELINRDLFLDRIRTQLIQYSGGKLVFIDRHIIEAVLAERQLKKSGDVGTSRDGLHVLLGADYFLTGEIMSIERRAGKHRATYTRYSFRLTDADSSAIIWEDDYEMKKVGRAGAWDR